jgi:hypothetical protein
MIVGPNPISPDQLSATERLAEIAEILAAGLIRLKARKSTPLSHVTGESSLHSLAQPSGHAPVLSREAEG